MTEIRRFPESGREPGRRKRPQATARHERPRHPPAVRLSTAPAQARMTLLAARALWGAALVTAPAGIVSAGVIAAGSGSAVPASPAQGPTVLTADTLPPSATVQPPAIVQQVAPASSGTAAQPIQWPSVPVPAAPPPTTLPIKGAYTLSGGIFGGIGVAGSVSVDSNGMAISVTPGFGAGGDVKFSGTPNGSVPTNGLQVGLTAKGGATVDPFGDFFPAISGKATFNVPLFSVDPNLNVSLSDLQNTSLTLEGSLKIPFVDRFSVAGTTKWNSESTTTAIGPDPTIQTTTGGPTITVAGKLFDFGTSAYAGPSFRIGLTWDQWLKYFAEVGNAEFMSQTGGQTLEDVLGPPTQTGQVTVSAPVTQPVPYLDFTTTPGAPAAPVNPITGVPDTAGVGPFGMMTPGTELIQPTPSQVIADGFATIQALPSSQTGYQPTPNNVVADAFASLPASSGNQQGVNPTGPGMLGIDQSGTYLQAPSSAPAWPAAPASSSPASTAPATGTPLPSRSDAGTPLTSDQAAAAQGSAVSPGTTVTQVSTASPVDTASSADTTSLPGAASSADTAAQAAAPQVVVQADPPQADATQATTPQAVVQADPTQAAAPQAVVQADPSVQADAPPDQAPAPAATQVASAYDPTASYNSGA